MSMTPSDIDRARLGRLRQDVLTTLGPDHVKAVDDQASGIAAWFPSPYLFFEKALEEVQQMFHDTFVDTTWPACPRHPNHPMWFRDGWWWCEQDNVQIAKLGELRSD